MAFDIGFDGVGDVIAFANLGAPSFAGIGGNTNITESIVISGSSVPAPAPLAF